MSEEEDSDKQLRIAFFDILNGYSLIEVDPPPSCSFYDHGKKITCFAKHFNFFDQVEMDKLHEQSFQRAKNKGLPTRKDNLQFLNESGDWTSSEEREWAGIKSYITTLEKTKAKIAIPSQAQAVQSQIDEQQQAFDLIDSKRASLIGQTCEAYADGFINSYTISSSLYSSEDLTSRLFSDDEVNYLDNRDLSILISAYNESVKYLSIDNIKKMSICGFFTSYYSIVEDSPMSFFKCEDAASLTFYQLNLLSYAKVLRSIIRNMDPPKDIIDDAEKLLEWSEKGEEQRKIMEKGNKEDGSYSVMGASKEDYEEMKVDRSGKSIFDLAKEGGGSLGIMDFINED